MPPRKRNSEEISALQEPPFDAEQQAHFKEGVRRFNSGRFWHAHESWEAAWLGMGDGPEDDGEMFLRALIQVASGLHLKKHGRHRGAKSHFAKASEKLAVMPDRYLGIDVAAVRVFARFQLQHFSEQYCFYLRRSLGESG